MDMRETLARIVKIAQDESRAMVDRLNHIHLLVERQLIGIGDGAEGGLDPEYFE